MRKVTACRWSVMSLFVLASCATYGPYQVSTLHPYGERIAAPGERLQEFRAGVRFITPRGTPVIAAADGTVISVIKQDLTAPWAGGYFVKVSHGEHFDSLYGHLSELHVQRGQFLKRGQLIGLSGGPNSGSEHLHLGICKKKTDCLTFSSTVNNTYDPGHYWLGGKPQCFDPNADYSRHSQREITLPLACGDYARELIARLTGKVRK